MRTASVSIRASRSEKAQHAKPMLGEPLCASLIPRALIFMLPSIQLDYHHAFRRNRSRRCRARSDAGDETARLIDAAADASRAAARRSGRGAVAVPGRAGEEACSSQKILGRGSAVKNRHPALPRWTPTPTPPKLRGRESNLEPEEHSKNLKLLTPLPW